MKITTSLICLSFIALSSITVAQKVTLNVTEGQKFAIESKIDSKSSFSVMGRDMENNSKSTFSSTAIFANKTTAGMDLTVSTNKVKVEASAMGQEMNYDSEKKDNDEKLEEIMKDLLGKSTVYNIDNNGNVIKVTAPKMNDETAGALTTIIGSSSITSNTIGIYLAYLFNKELKVGMAWTDSTEVKGDLATKTINNYNIVSISNDSIMVNNKGNILSNGIMKQMNMEMKTSGNSKFETTYKIDIKTGLITDIDTKSDINTNVEAGGMNITVSGNTTTKILIALVK